MWRITVLPAYAAGTVRRTAEERAVDLLLELIALDAAAESPPVHLGATVFQKILFWSRMQLHELSLALPRLSYRRHHYGPYSQELADDLKLLRELGHLDRATFRISPRAAEIVRHWTRLLEPRNREAFATVRKVARDLAPLTADEVKSRTYDLPSQRVGAHSKYGTLAGIPKGVYLLLRRARPLRSFEISPALNIDLVLELSMNADVAARLKTPERGPAFRSVDEMSAALEREPTS